jgi:hypothetical protein
MCYSIPIANLKKTTINPPRTPALLAFQMKSATLGDICGELKAINDASTVIADQGEIYFQAKNTLMGEAKIHLEEIQIITEAPVSTHKEVNFSSHYLAKMCKIAKKTDSVVVEIPTNKGDPLNFVFSTENGTQLEFLLAPRVSTD